MFFYNLVSDLNDSSNNLFDQDGVYFEQRQEIFAKYSQFIDRSMERWRLRLLEAAHTNDFLIYSHFFLVQFAYLQFINARKESDVQNYLICSNQRECFMSTIRVFEAWKCVAFFNCDAISLNLNEIDSQEIINIRQAIQNCDFSQLANLLSQTNTADLEYEILHNYILNEFLLPNLKKSPARKIVQKILRCIALIKKNTAIEQEYSDFICNIVFECNVAGTLESMKRFEIAYLKYFHNYNDAPSVVEKILVNLLHQNECQFDEDLGQIDKIFCNLCTLHMKNIQNIRENFINRIITNWIIEKGKFVVEILKNSFSMNLSENIWPFLDALFCFLNFYNNHKLNSKFDDCIYEQFSNILDSYIEYYSEMFDEIFKRNLKGFTVDDEFNYEAIISVQEKVNFIPHENCKDFLFWIRNLIVIVEVISHKFQPIPIQLIELLMERFLYFCIRISNYFAIDFLTSIQNNFNVKCLLKSFEKYYENIFSNFSIYFVDYPHLTNVFLGHVYEALIKQLEGFVFYHLKLKKIRSIMDEFKDCLEQIEDFFVKHPDSLFGIEWERAHQISGDLFASISAIMKLSRVAFLEIIKSQMNPAQTKTNLKAAIPTQFFRPNCWSIRERANLLSAAKLTRLLYISTKGDKKLIKKLFE